MYDGRDNETRLDRRWSGANKKSRLIVVLYRLSQEGQREAFLTTDPRTSYRRVRSPSLFYTHELYRDAFELAWFSPRGNAYVFVGGREAFALRRGGAEDKDEWEPAEGTVPGIWIPSLKSGEYFSRWGCEQQQELPLLWDRPNVEIHDLLDAEQVRLFQIRQSRQQAKKEAAARNEED